MHFELDKGLRHDLLLWRQQATVTAVVRDFQPNYGIGGDVAKKLQLPLAISWHAVLAFYRLGDVMTRGIDTQFFTPARRTADDGVLRLGYVGRITPEKSVRFLRDLEIGLEATRSAM
ncbi:MAG TPA: hypothetical protein VGM43_20940 [Bryobacteraceae bacterium]